MINFGWNSIPNITLSSMPSSSIFDQSNNISIEQILDYDSLFDEIHLHLSRVSHCFHNKYSLVQSLLEYSLNPENVCSFERRSFVATEIFACEIPGVLDWFFVSEGQKNQEEGHKNQEEGFIKSKASVDQIATKIMEIEEENEDERVLEKYEEESKSDLSDENKKLDIQFSKSPGTGLMQKLFSVLKHEVIPESSAFAFKKILSALLNQKGFETISYVYQNDEIVHDILRNVQTNEVFSEVLYRILLIDCCYSHMTENLFLERRKAIIFQIYEKIHRMNFQESELENYVIILIDLLENHQKGNHGKELLNAIIDQHNLDIIFGCFESKNEEIIKNLGKLLHCILSFQINERKNTQFRIHFYTETEKNEIKARGNVILLFAKKLGLFNEMLCGRKKQMKNEKKGSHSKIFGLGRLKILECLQVFLSLNDEECLNSLEIPKFYENLLDLFSLYPNNNILHSLLYKILESSISLNFFALNYAIFEEAKIVDFLISHLSQYDPKIKLANILMSDKFNSNCELMKYLGKNEEWQEFVKSNLQKINEINETEMGGSHPKQRGFPGQNAYQKEELDDFDMLFIDHKNLSDNYANNTNNSPNQEEFTFNDLQNDLVNMEGGFFSMKYQPEEENLLDRQFDFISEQISALNFNNEL